MLKALLFFAVLWTANASIIQTIGYSIVDSTGAVLCRQDETASDCAAAYPGMGAGAGPNTSAHLNVWREDDYTYGGYFLLWNDLRAWSDDLSNNLYVVAYSRLQVEITEYIQNPFPQGARVSVRQLDPGSDFYGCCPVFSYPYFSYPYFASSGSDSLVPSSIQYGSEIPVSLFLDSTILTSVPDNGIRYREWWSNFEIKIEAASVPEPGTACLGLAALACILFTRRRSSL